MTDPDDPVLFTVECEWTPLPPGTPAAPRPPDRPRPREPFGTGDAAIISVELTAHPPVKPEPPPG